MPKDPVEEPGKRAKRLTSKQMQEITSVVNQFKARRGYYVNQIKRMQTSIQDDAVFSAWGKGEITERIKKIDDASVKLEEIYMELICMEEISQEETVDNNEISDLIVALKGKMVDRLDALNKADPSQATSDRLMNLDQPFRIEVQQMDATGNIPNVWGDFDGDYAKWKSFRDRWVASMHNNEKVPTITKFQNLKKACIGQAEGALGEWDLTEENYQRAWERLESIYEDDYMQVQSFMQKLEDLPAMCGTSSKTIRNTIDIVQKHIHGLK